MGKALTRWVIGSAVMLVLLLPHLRMFGVEATRYYTFWSRADAIALALLIVGGGAILAGLHAVARRVGLTRAANASCVAAVGVGSVVTLCSGKGVGPGWQTIATILCIAVGGLVLLALTQRGRGVVRATRALCLIIAPAGLVLVGPLFFSPEFSVIREPLPAADPAPRAAALTGGPPSHAAGNVYLFIFDEWSYARTFTDDLPQEMPHLHELLSRATVYHRAHAPYHATRLSLPAILYQTDELYTWQGGRLGFRSRPDAPQDDLRTRSNLFSHFKTRGYRTHLIGFSHPYRRMFGAELDYCHAAADRRGDDDSRLEWDDLARHLRMAASTLALTIPKPEALTWRVHRWTGVFDPTPELERVRDMHGRALCIVTQPGPGMSVFHYALPHAPLMFDRDGAHPELTEDQPLTFADHDGNGFVRPHPAHHLARYRGNLRYLDTLLGELIAAMRSAGTFDGATIILTSDHNWRFDPALDDLYIEHGLPFRSLEFDPVPEVLTHVPLIIRRPGQARRVDVAERVELIELLDLLDQPAGDEPVVRDTAAVAGAEVEVGAAGGIATSLNRRSR
jgi:hypothetical protein